MLRGGLACSGRECGDQHHSRQGRAGQWVRRGRGGLGFCLACSSGKGCCVRPMGQVHLQLRLLLVQPLPLPRRVWEVLLCCSPGCSARVPGHLSHARRLVLLVSWKGCCRLAPALCPGGHRLALLVLPRRLLRGRVLRWPLRASGGGAAAAGIGTPGCARGGRWGMGSAWGLGKPHCVRVMQGEDRTSRTCGSVRARQPTRRMDRCMDACGFLALEVGRLRSRWAERRNGMRCTDDGTAVL